MLSRVMVINYNVNRSSHYYRYQLSGVCSQLSGVINMLSGAVVMGEVDEKQIVTLIGNQSTHLSISSSIQQSIGQAINQ